MFNCDIFCEVIDNYGDAGVCWRIARMLTNEKNADVRLFVSDLKTLSAIVPECDPEKNVQTVQGIEICAWSEALNADPAPVILETFACRLPQEYEKRAAERSPQSVWINIDYLSAEQWVEDWHLLPSPHPTLPINKYYFYPGFTDKTGGLIFEKDILDREAAFMPERNEYLKNLGADPAHPFSLFVFCYPGEWIDNFYEALASDKRPVQLLLAPGAAGNDLMKMLEEKPIEGVSAVRLPFFDQKDFEKILWCADALIIRGEDSFVRAQTVARPFLWNIYPIKEGTEHIDKLCAFADIFGRSMPETAELWKRINVAWNTSDKGFVPLWSEWRDAVPAMQTSIREWRKQIIDRGSLIDHLCKFAKDKLK